MHWIYLLAAGLLEIGFTTCLKFADGFTKLWPSLGFLAFAAGSFTCLTIAIKDIPLGTAYAIWTGIGAAGTVIVGILVFKESADVLRLVFLGLLVASIVGIKLVSAH